jgi:uncharacterized protein YndB with AHSA1/START domain
MHFETSVQIDRPREAVFRIVSDPETYPRWNSAVKAVHPLGTTTGTPAYRMERRLPTGRVENLLEVLSATPPSEVVIRASDGPTPFTYRYTLREANGGTELALAADVELEGLPRLLGPLAAAMVKRGVDENLAALKSLLEPS